MRLLAVWWASLWLRLLFALASSMPWLPRLLRPVAVRSAWLTSRQIRDATRANAKRLIAPDVSEECARAFALLVIGRFYDAVLEFGTNRGLGPDELARRLEQVQGQERYDQARGLGRGAVLVTAHLGSFETAIGMLRQVEPRIHVVFQRDAFSSFERARSRQRRRLGVIEAPVDEGFTTWLGLRDALTADEVVLIQADRCMPGQRGVPVPFLGGHLRVPTGPVRLARLTGSPIIPVFALSMPKHRVRVVLGRPIHPADHARPAPGQADPILGLIAAEIEGVVKEYPSQWLCLHPVLVEDQAQGARILWPR